MLDLDGLRAAVRRLPADVPAAVTMNTHTTALAIARSLGRRGIPVVGLDKEPGGIGQHSRYLSALGRCPGPGADGEELCAFLLELAGAFQTPPVLFPTNDDWVLALAAHHDALSSSYRLPFPPLPVVATALAKSSLYRAAQRLGVPIPATWWLDEGRPVEAVAAEVRYPAVVKPDDSRGFYDAFGVKVFPVADAGELVEAVRRCEAAGLAVVAQAHVATPPGGFVSVCSYLSPGGTARGVVVGRKLEQWPPGYGTCCLADTGWDPVLAERGVAVLRALGYHGVSELELVLDPATGEHLLLDANTRPWKWVGLPVAAGVDLPHLAWSDAIGRPYSAPAQRDGVRWVFLRDYLQLTAARAATVPHEALSHDEWVGLLAGRPPFGVTIVDGAHDPDDPEPSYDVLLGELRGGGAATYSCAC